MGKVLHIGSLLKKHYRYYSSLVLKKLQEKGYRDLRPSFFEIMSYIAENDGAFIAQIGDFCDLKKQTMTGHLHELEKRGYVVRKTDPNNGRIIRIHLTPLGEKFRFDFVECKKELELHFVSILGETEVERLQTILQLSYDKLIKNE